MSNSQIGQAYDDSHAVADGLLRRNPSILTMDPSLMHGSAIRPQVLLLSSASHLLDQKEKMSCTTSLLNSRVFLLLTGALIVTSMTNLTISLWLVNSLRLGNVSPNKMTISFQVTDYIIWKHTVEQSRTWSRGLRERDRIAKRVCLCRQHGYQQHKRRLRGRAADHGQWAGKRTQSQYKGRNQHFVNR